MSATAVRHDAFIRLGLTDAVVLEVLKQGGQLATSDLDLYLAALRLNYDAINFNHLREYALR